MVGRPCAASSVARARLRGEALEHLGRRADERQAVGARHLGEACRPRTGSRSPGGSASQPRHEGGRQDGRRRQVAAPRLGRPDADRLVGQLDGARVAVGLAVGDDRVDAQACGRRAGCAARSRRGWRSGCARTSGRTASPDRGSVRASGSSRTSALAVLDRLARPRPRARRATPSTGATTSWRTPSTSTWPSTSPGADRPPDRRGRRAATK